MGVPLYPAGYRCDLTISEVIQRFGQMDHESLEKTGNPSPWRAESWLSVILEGLLRPCQRQDRRIQAYIRKDRVGEENFRVFKLMDVGDFVGIKGSFFRTKTGELTILADHIRLLSKSVRPLPEKWHGLTDVETRYRQRYLDLIANDAVKIFLS